MTTHSATTPSHLPDVVQPHPYSVRLTFKGESKNWPPLKGDIYEHDVCIGKFYRGAVRHNFVPPIVYQFYSTQARNRFDDFANCLSIEETIEALIE